ncbi:MAG: helix-turn-helix transcriptional regulator [Oscillospiraceae bacterium]
MSKDIQFKNRDRFIELGLTIASIRKMQGMSQEQLAYKACISRSHLSSIEAPNIVRPFSLEVLYNIADALAINPGDLLNVTLPSCNRR